MQKVQVVELLREYEVTEIHHGGCKGADAEFDTICHAECIGVHPRSQFVIVVHPSDVKGMHGLVMQPCTLLEEYPPLERNHHIVDAVELMIATPGGMHEMLRSGTWACIRYARRRHRDTYIVWPDGSVKGEWYG